MKKLWGGRVNNSLSLIIGSILTVLGMVLSVLLKVAHFYSLFSIGMLLIFIAIYNLISKRNIFTGWKAKQYLIFFVLMLAVSIVTDRIGIFLGYWSYPSYVSLFDEALKYIVEWVVAQTYIMLGFLVGWRLAEKNISSRKAVKIVTAIIFTLAIGLFTQYINLFSNSWVVNSMPFTNYKIGDYFIIFQTVGYLLMALIPLMLFKVTEKTRSLETH